MAKNAAQVPRRKRAAADTPEKSPNHKRILIGALLGLVLIVITVLAFWGVLLPLHYARQAVVERDSPRANEWLALARRWDSNNPEVEFLAARIARHEQRYQDMEQHLQNAVRFGLDRQRVRREELLVLASDGKLEGIEEQLHRELAAADGDQAEVCEALTNGLAKVARYDEAQMLCEAWVNDFPKDPYPHCRLGRIHEHFRRPDSAEREYRNALAKNPRCYLAIYALARILEEQKRVEEALTLYRRCSELPNPVPAKVGMAMCLKSLGRIDEAQKLLEEAVRVDEPSRIAAYKAIGETPDTFVAAMQLGTLYSQNGDQANAERWLREALQANPRDLLARYAYAVALRGLGQAEESQRQFAMVQKARKALEEVSTLYDYVESHPSDADARFKLGKVLLEYESERKGIFYLKTVLTYDPRHEPTLRLLEEYEKKSPADRLAEFGGAKGLPPPIGLAKNHPSAVASLSKIPQQPNDKDQVGKLLMKTALGQQPIHFVDATRKSGINATYHNGREGGANSILETLGGGAGILDYDRDGWPDLCFPGGGKINPAEQSISGLPTSLWRGRGQMRFEDASVPAAIDHSRRYTHGVLIGDYDSDGFPDVLLTGYGGLQLFRNEGDGTFQEVTAAAQLDDKLWSTSGGWGDFNGDGNLDLFVAHYVDWSWSNHPKCPGGRPGTLDVCSPREFTGLPDALYISNGDGTFRDVSREMGLDPAGKGLGAVTADVDLDGDLDIYVANDTTNNFLYLNDKTGKMSESGFISGTAVDHRGIPNGSMGIAVFDFNHDLLPDIWVTNFENEAFALYRNEQQGSFICVSEGAGITALERVFVGFGTVAGDFDHDGDEDIAVTNGHVMYHLKDRDGPQESLVLSNDGRGQFQNLEFGRESFFSQKHVGRGLAASDLDRDGDLDLVFAFSNEPAAILTNEINLPQQSFILQLSGTDSNRDAIGARVVLHTTTGDYLRLVCGGGSYLSQPEFHLHWGLAAGTSVQGATIYWPSGKVQQVDITTPGMHAIVEK